MRLAEGAAAALARARRYPAAGYGVGVVAVLLVTFLKVRFDWVGRDAPVAIYLGAIMLVAWFGGTGPGLAATAFSCLAGAYLFAEPYDSLAVASADDAVRIVVAALEGVLISLLAGALRRANEELRRHVIERTSAEAALRRANEQAVHAHKMRVMGEFAGGIAHDFNNMLTVVQACLGLLERRLASDHPGRVEVAEIRAATDRAAALARQLLTFSRRRDVDVAKVHMHDVVARIRPLVCRLVGPAIRVDVALDARRDLVFADVAQLEQAIVNLAANGRDAMPDGGTLTIATADASPATCRALARRAGPHVEITVRDSGLGMDDATRARVFEPFFSTKPSGAGTGLGLSMVLEVVEAIDGAVAIESELGKGATVRIVLPVVEESALPAVSAHS